MLKRGHEAAEKCHICLKKFNDPQNKKVRDHCHYTGLYRGVAHNNCNLKYGIPDHIPIVFHNLGGYDAHLFIKKLGKRVNKNDIGVIAEDKEKCSSFNVKTNVMLEGMSNENCAEVCKNIQFRFIDSCRFMALGLHKLASNLDDDQYKHLREFYKEEEVFRLMRRKGVYPYEYMDSWKKLKETSLPPKDVFYSRLNMKGISDQDYEHAQQVWNRITPEHENITLGDCDDVYYATDVLLLADVFETFRSLCPEHYRLDPAHFYTAPGLTWQDLLKTAPEYCECEKRHKDCDICPEEFRLELLTDIDMLLMFEKGIRGGITQAVKRCAKVNNKYMKDLYNPDEESIYLQYLDANNLYGWAMVQKLPTHGFLWKEAENFTPEKINELVQKDNSEYLLEVDLEYPTELHKNHNELPFLMQKMKIRRGGKLVPNLRDKKGYVVHIKTLNQALKHDLKLRKVHQVIEFQHSNWMKPYIMLNTRLRTAAKKEFEKEFFKLMNNSVFGKTMESIRNHKDMKLVTRERKYQKYVMKPNFKDGYPSSKHLFAVEMGKKEIKMNRPVYLGQTILDLSKMLMYEFLYDYMRLKYGR